MRLSNSIKAVVSALAVTFMLSSSVALADDSQKVVVTAGRDNLGQLAPEFARYNDDILFGEVWSDKTLSLKQRSMITVTTLVASGITDSSLKFHLQNAKKNGVTKEEMAAMITHIAFYAGWPKAWAAFNMIKDIYKD